MTYVRFGGELPLGADLVGSYQPLPDNVYGFSHGRAALSWLVAQRGPFGSAVACAYTCPTVSQHLARLGLPLGLFDHGATIDDVVAAIPGAPGRCLVIVPMPFGAQPWLGAEALARRLGERAMVVIDGAQSAFAAIDKAVPSGGAVLSCPRKAMALGDGALLALEHGDERERNAIAALPTAVEASRAKTAARALFAARDVDRESEARALAQRAEQAFPAEPHRMSDAARAQICNADRSAHRARRRNNAARLAACLKADVEFAVDDGFWSVPSVPFTLPILHSERDRFIKALHRRRVFATPLWPDAIHDPQKHPRAADMARRLVALPVDQRYEPADMDRLAALVRECL